MSLTDVAIRKAKPRDKDYKLSDEKGLYLLVRSNGSKYWRYKYRISGKEKIFAIGVYPDVSLAQAREKLDEARKLVSKDIDPNVVKKTSKHLTKTAQENSFEIIAREWFAKKSGAWKPSHSEKIMSRLEKNAFPWLGNRPITEIEAPELLTMLQRVENRGAIDTAHRVRQYCNQIFRYAITTGRVKHNPVGDLYGALQPIKTTHYSTITDPKAIGGLLRSIMGYQGQFVTGCALRLMPYVFVRHTELRMMEWLELDFEEALWRIPAEKMKMETMHLVPLSTQAISIIRELQPLTGNGKYVFPGILSSNKPISENTLLSALRRLGYTKEDMTVHGFRSMASTRLNELGWNRDAIERQLAHIEQNQVRAAYNHAEYLSERRKMMQYWADYLDSLLSSTKNTVLAV